MNAKQQAIFNKLEKCILNKEVISIFYKDVNNPDNVEILSGRRIDIEPVALGISVANNEVVRAWVHRGESLRGLPGWKMFRVDRIDRIFDSGWVKSKATKKNFLKPRPLYNPSGDRGMLKVFVNVKF